MMSLIICAEREAGCAMPNSGAGDAACGLIEPAGYSEAEYLVGPALLREGHALLAKQFARQEASLQELLANMARSERAKASAKYQETAQLAQALAELKAMYKVLVQCGFCGSGVEDLLPEGNPLTPVK